MRSVCDLFQVRRRLVPGGRYMMNVVSNVNGTGQEPYKQASGGIVAASNLINMMQVISSMLQVNTSLLQMSASMLQVNASMLQVSLRVLQVTLSSKFINVANSVVNSNSTS